ncbi:MAG: DNA translocase FtsK, partial [Planctomycetota bacterium JB042]
FVKTESPFYAKELVQKNVQAEVDPREVDDLYEQAVRFIMETKRGSASLLQRKFAIGYTRASRLIDLMAEDGILGEYRNAQAREVLMTVEEYDERNRARDDG